MTYFDTSVILKTYVPEPNSHEAVALVAAAGHPVPCNMFSMLEIQNAFRLKAGRSEISSDELRLVTAQFRADIAHGILEEHRPDWTAVFRRAESISHGHTTGTLSRTLDILHVATAMEIGASEFRTFDKKQATLARLLGLNVNL